ncbi:Crp/Fnr family transcriptional regulator [Vibrio rumoiensis]|uniref:Crp/Fnr family transcriptional regulator n=1 Tax=Vibrio rumoiensis TaxID=76258 RepID=UPI000B5CAC77|nr:Crp/Fnr family transcriptional regulator [Vibrio rumoiensis]
MLMDYVKYSVLSQCDWFVNADHQNIVSLTQLVHLEHFEKNTEIVRQGDRNSDIGILADGELEIIYQSPQNQIIPISKIKPLGWFGESALSQNSPLVSVKTTQDSSIIFISKEALMHVMSKDTAIMNNVMKCLADRITSISRFALTYIDNDTLSKIGKQILNQVEMFSPYSCSSEVIELRLTKSDIAALIGQTRQSIIPYLNQYSDLKLLTFGYGTVKINNIDKLKVYIDGLAS